MKNNFNVLALLICLSSFLCCDGNKSSETSKVPSPKIYFKQSKYFYFEVSVNERIIDTICLKTYPFVTPVIEQGTVSWIYDINSTKPKLFETGVIENDSVIWIHPPRESFYNILGIVAFPQILKPYVLGKTWSWELQVSDMFTIPSWNIEWDGLLNCTFNYALDKRVSYESRFHKMLNCIVIIAQTTSKVGSSNSVFLFNEEYGFVKLEYSLYGKLIRLELLKMQPYSKTSPFLP